ncbi:meckelin isoform X3 [Entelurus aequoreus]|uniref:meckelin isoform X3 n=1 Tax=Entelurus aequoreus TaxID=161455 RepID=UPI002B1E49BE|nr:meckelin isoform X3 [Entelurus aequoreus]
MALVHYCKDGCPHTKRGRNHHTMATGTLLPFHCRYEVRFIVFNCIHFISLHGQQYIIPYETPSNCSVDEFFDFSSLSCASCGPNQQQNAAGLSCICKSGFRTVTTEQTSITCESCPGDKPAVTKDGFGCIRCPSSLNDAGQCQCPPGYILVERDVSGNLLDEAVCEMCNGNVSAFSVPNRRGERCERCQASFIKSSCVCNSPSVLAGGLCLPQSSLATNVNPSVNFAQLKVSVLSAWFVKNLYSSAAACLSFSNLTACQALGNMCVMNMHSFSGISTDACGLFNTVFRSRAAFSPTQDISYWRQNLPWLYYGDEPGLASRVLQTDPVPVSFSFRGRNKNTDIKLLAAVYNVRGVFLRWENIGGSNLLICPETAIKRLSAFSFGTSYQESCDVSVADLVHTLPEPLLYDVFMDLGGEDSRKLLPLPTLVYNQQYNGRFINQESMKSWYLSRRMFLVDALSGREKNTNSLPKVIRVANSVKIRFQLVPNTQEGQVFPPLLTVEYRDVPITDIDTQTVSMSFALEYEMDQSEARMKTDTALGVLAGLSVLLSVLKTVSWKRRIASPIVDLRTMLMFFLFYAGDLANVFLAVTVGTGLYWLILYKAQQQASVLLPLPQQEEQFVTYISCAFALKISVLLLPHRCFGYYIHGRSVHGHADTNMEEMSNNLRREAESMCGQRGLLPNTDIQTFQVALSIRLRSHYDKIRESFTRRHGPSRLIDAASANQLDPNIRAYHTMNHFLGSIIDHAHPDMDYYVRDKLTFERVMGMEFLEPNDKSIFYNDEGHSFSDVLYYGNEGTLLIFDTLFFCVVDLVSQSFVLAAVLTYVQQMIFKRIRNVFGRRNIVNKTLVDDRFLI